MQLTVGPILYAWPRARIEAFYDEMLDSPASVLYLGEIVCSKRRALKPDEWLSLARDLAARGKQVVISTYALVESGAELGTVKRLCANGEVLVEANEIGAVQLLAERAVPFVGGPGLNIYNERALALLCRRGMRRWVPPLELSGAALAALLARARDSGDIGELETEVFACGRMPLAYSARCFTARHLGLRKDECAIACAGYPSGLPMSTRDGQALFTINGTQIQSTAVQHLLPYWREMADMGVSLLRLSPQDQGLGQLLRAYATVLAGETPEVQPQEFLEGPCADGYWRGAAGISTCA